jgi:hypothetical protein
MSFERFEAGKNPLPWLQKKGDSATVSPEEAPPAAPSPGDQVERDTDGSNGVEKESVPSEQIDAARQPADARAPVAASTLSDRDEQQSVVAAESAPANGAVAAESDQGSTSTRIRLSEILREAEAQRTVTLDPIPNTQSAQTPRKTSLAGAAAPLAVTPRTSPEPVSEDEYPTLLERPRDGKTQPFVDMMPEAMADDIDQDFKELDSLPKARDPLATAGPAPYVAPPPTRERRFQSHTAGRIPWRAVSVFVLAIALAGFIGAFSGWILTSEESASDVNRRIAAELTEIDRYLANNQEAIAQAEPNEDGRITLPDYPLPITLSPEEAALSTSEMRDVILDDAAALMYADGVEAYGADSSIFDDLSTPGLVRFGMQLMQESTHDALLVLMILSAVFTVGAAALVLLVTERGSRLTAFGAAVSLAGLLALLGSLLMRFVLDRAASRESDQLADGLGDIAEDVSFLFTRNSLVFLAVGLVILTAGFVLNRMDSRPGSTELRTREPANVA